jgi:hypothetical protein
VTTPPKRVASVKDKQAVIDAIREAFADVEYPGDWCLRGSNEGDEPYLLEEEFKGKTDWRTIEPAFLDRAPAGYGSALSFFSDEAFRFYLPAYLIADLNGELERADVVFHLTHGLNHENRDERVNPRRYGARTWFDAATYRFSCFNQKQASAIVGFLELKRKSKDAVEFEQRMIDDALESYWFARAKV